MPLSEFKARPIIDRISIVLRPTEGGSLEQIAQYVQLGAPVAIGRAGAVIAEASDEDFHVTIGREREQHAEQVDLLQAALTVDPLLTACAPEMFSLLERIEVKCGGLNAVLGHGIEPSEQMWEDSRQALDDVWPLLCKARGKEYVPDPVDPEQVNHQQNAPQNIPAIIPGPWADVQCLDFCSVALRHVVVEGDLQFSDINDALRYMAKKGYLAFPRQPGFNIDDHVQMAADARRYHWLKACEFEQANNLIVDVSEDDWDAKIDDAIRLQALEAEPCEQ